MSVLAIPSHSLLYCFHDDLTLCFLSECYTRYDIFIFVTRTRNTSSNKTRKSTLNLFIGNITVGN